MAKNKLDDDYDLDDIDFEDFNDDSFGDFNSMNKPKSAREAAVGIAGSFVSGMGNELLNPTTQRRIIKAAMPDGFAQGHDAMFAAIDSTNELMSEVNKGMGELLKTTKTSVNTILPKLESILPDKILKGIQEWSRPEESHSYGRGNDEEDAISGHLADMGKALEQIQSQQAEQDKRSRLRSDSINLATGAANQKLLEQQNEHLLNIRKLMNRTVAGQEQVAFKFHQKSLEIQYRTYFATRKLADTAEKTLALQEAAFEKLVHNTSLPDVVKIRNSEIASQMLKERAFQAVMTSTKDTFSRVGKRIVQQAKPKIQEFFRDSNSAISDINGIFDMASQGSDYGVDMNEMVAELMGNAAMGWGSDKLGEYLNKRFGNNENLKRQGLAILNFLNNQEGYLADAMDIGVGGNKLTDFIRDHLGGDAFFVNQGARTLKGARSAGDMDEHASLRWRTVNTIEEVIPGWLQMMHNEMQMMRTGDHTLRPHYWNASKGAFESEAKTKQRLKELVRDNVEYESEAAGDLLNVIDEKQKLSKGTREKLLKYVVTNRRNKHKRINLKDIAAGNTDIGLSMAELDEVYDLVQEMEGGYWDGDRSTVEGRIKDDASSSLEYQEHKTRLDRAHGRLLDSVRDRDIDLQDAIQAGQGSLLEELGLIKYKEDGSVITDEDRRIDRITKRGTKYLARGGATGPGDKFERKGVVHANEFVVRSEAAMQPGAKSFLDAFNHKGMAALQGYDTGGMVGRVKNYQVKDDANRGLGDALIDAIRDNNPGEALREANEKLHGILNLTAELVQNGITAYGMGSGRQGILETAASKGMGFAKWLGGKTLAWNKWLAPKTLQGIKGAGRLGKNAVMGDFKKFALGGVGKDDIAIDVYTASSNVPVLTKRGFLNGEYIDKITGKVIRSLKDIEGDVYDRSGNLVLSMQEISQGLFAGDGRDVRKIWSGLFSKLKGIAGWSIGATFKSWKAQLNVMGRIKNRLKRAWNIMPDIYVKGEESPRLLARLLNAGKYMVKRNGMPVASLNDIDGEIVDMDGNTVLTMDDIQRGLVTKDGDDVTTRGARMLRGVRKFVAGGKKYIKGAWDFAKNAVSTGWDASTAILGGLRDLVFGGGVSVIGNKSKNVLFEIRDILDDRLPSNKSVFGDQDGDGDRDNGVKDILERRAKAKEDKDEKLLTPEEKEKKKSGWGLMSILTGLGGMLSGIYSTVTGGIAETVSWLKRIAMARTLTSAAGTAADILDAGDGKGKKRGRGRGTGRGGLLRRAGQSGMRLPGWGKVAAGAALAGGTYMAMSGGSSNDPSKMTHDVTGRPMMQDNEPGFMRKVWNGMTDGGTADGVASLGASTALGTAGLAAGAGAIGGLAAGGGLAGAGLGALAALGGPVTLGIIAVGAAVYAGAKLYKAMTSTDGDLSRFRMTQYGFSGTDADRAGKLLQLEQIMLRQVSIGTDGSVKIKNGVPAREVVELFGLSSEKEILSLNHWLIYRFRPIFDTWVKSYASIQPSGKFTEADKKLPAAAKLELLKLVHSPNGVIYNVNSSPFTSPPTAAFVGSDVDRVYYSTRQKIESGKSGGAKASSSPIAAANAMSGSSGAKLALKNANETGGGLSGTAPAGTSTKVGAAGVAGGKDSVGKPVGGIAAAAAAAQNNASKAPEEKKSGGGIFDFLGGAFKKAGNAISTTFGGAIADTVGVFQGSGGSVGDIPQAKGKGWANVKDTIIAASKMVGVDPSLLAGVAAIESGFNPAAKAGTSSAAGLFQFINSTWKAMVSKYGKTYGIPGNASPLDARINAVLGAAYIKENAQVVRSVKGSVNPTDVYMAHFLGSGGIKKFLQAMRSNPQASAAALLPAAAKANKAIFYDNGRARTLAEVYQLMQQKMSTRAGQHGVDLKNLNASSPAAAPAQTSAATKGNEKKAPTPQKTSSGIPLTIAKPGSQAAPATGVPAAQKQADGIMSAAKTNIATGNTSGTTAGATVAPDKLKRLLANATDELVKLGQKACTTQSGVNVSRMNKDFMRLFYAMVGSWVQAGYGKSLVITSGWRDTEKQRVLYENYVRTKKPPMAAKPGKSKHEFGIALDVNSVNANSLASSGLLSRWGFFRPLLKHPSYPEPWHIEHSYFTKSAGGNTAKEVVNAGNAPANAATPKRVERKMNGGTVTGVIDPTDGEIKPIGDILTGDSKTTAKPVDPSTDVAKAQTKADDNLKGTKTKTVQNNFENPENTANTKAAKSHNFNEANPQLSPQQIEADKKKLNSVQATPVSTVQLPATMSPKQRQEAQAAMVSNQEVNKYFERSIAIQTSMDSTLKQMLTELQGVNKGQQGVAKGLLAQAEATLANKGGNGAPAQKATTQNTRDPISLRA